MGKQAKRKASGYEHVHTHNPKARESNERKLFNIQSLAIKRFQGYVDKIRDTMRNYVPPESIAKSKMDPTYELKGAARAAQEFYRPPGYEPPVPPRNLLEEYNGRMWENAEGRKLLSALVDLGLALHNIGSRSKDAIRIFQEAIAQDPADHLVVRHRLLRCLLDEGDGLRARELLDVMNSVAPAAPARSSEKKGKNSGSGSSGNKLKNGVTPSPTGPDNRSCSCYNRAFIEHIAIMLEEPDASEDLRDQRLEEAYQQNPFTLWVIAHHQVFKEVLSRTPLLCDKEVLPHIPPHTLEDALVFFEADLPLWLQTDGVVEWVQDYIKTHKLAPPSLDTPNAKTGINSEADSAVVLSAAANDGVPLSSADLHDMFADMFTTAFEIIND